MKFRNLLLCEHKVPRITPKNTHNVTDKPINPTVCNDSFHIPTAPQKYITNNEYIPSLKPPVAKQGKNIIATTKTQGESIRKSSIK
jgi:hypothetical protein